MAFRSDLIAGRAIILVSIEDTIDKQLRSIRTKLRRFSNSLSTLGGDLFRFGTVGTIGSIFPVKEFVQFQDRMLFIQTKLQATDGQMRGLEMTIRGLGKSTSFTSEEVGQAAQILAQAGLSLKEIEDSLLPTLDLARAGGVELDTAANLLVQGLQSFELETRQATELASKMITTVRKGPLTIIDLGESFKYASGTAAELNVQVEDVLTMMALLSRSGTRGTLSGTQINKALQSLATEQEKLSNILGISFTDSDFETPITLFTKMGTALTGMTRMERIAALTEIGSIRAARALSPLIRKTDQYEEILREVTESTNEARSAAEKLDSRLGGVWRRALSSAQEFMLAVGGQSEGPLTIIGEVLRQAFNSLSSLATSNPRTVQTLLLLPPALMAAGAGMLTFAFALNQLTIFIAPLMAINKLFMSLGGVAVSGVMAAFSPGMWKKAFAMFSKSGARSLMGGFLGFFKKAGPLGLILSTLPHLDIFKSMGGGLKQIFDVIASAAPGVKTVIEGIKLLAEGDADGGLGLMKVGLQDIINILRTGFLYIWEEAQRKMGAVGQIIKAIAINVWNLVGGLFKMAGILTAGVLNEAFKTLQEIFMGEGDIFNPEGINSFFEALFNAFKTIFVSILRALDWITGTFKSLIWESYRLQKNISKIPGLGGLRPERPTFERTKFGEAAAKIEALQYRGAAVPPPEGSRLQAYEAAMRDAKGRIAQSVREGTKEAFSGGGGVGGNTSFYKTMGMDKTIEDLAKSRAIIGSLVGSFADTRGNKIKIAPSDLDKDRNITLQGIETGIQDLAKQMKFQWQ